MSTPEQPARLAPEIEPLLYAILRKRIAENDAAARAILEPLYAEGDKRTVRSPIDEAKLGTVSRSDPDPRWTIVDRAALTRHLADNPDNVEYVDDIAATEADVVAVLRVHAPHLLAQVERVREDAVIAALDAARKGEGTAPGIARVKPPGTLSVRPDKNAAAAIERMIAAGVITWDGRRGELSADVIEAVIHEADCADDTCTCGAEAVSA